MSDTTATRRPRRGLFIALAVLLVAAVAWSGFWFYAASKAEVAVDAWAAHEARSGRVYDCAKRSITGFPFRFEVRCSGARVSLVSQTASRTPFTAKLDNIRVVAEITDPRRVTAEFTAPATLTDEATQTSFAVNWSRGYSNVVGLPAAQRGGSIAFDDPTVDRLDGSVHVPLVRARQIELQGRLAGGSPLDHPVIETEMRIAQGSIFGLHPLLAEPFDADVRAKVTGLADIRPKPWPQRFREIQAAGGHVEIVQSRVQQGETIVVATGVLGLTASGHLDGALQVTVAGIDRVIPALGIDKMLEEAQSTQDRGAVGAKARGINNLLGALDRAVPGLGKVVRQNANASVVAGFNLLGTGSELEGRKARSFPLRITDGAVRLGPLKVAQIPPLF